MNVREEAREGSPDGEWEGIVSIKRLEMVRVVEREDKRGGK